ncbi:hypothetical protein BVRB_2g034280 [Beta vulgaris subsp. vulgaris]|uniref:uncharacterized protein At4g33100 n=1 Tax=Beta vulgaris subsp. vulgaris TaxID=3555 RepID=UPI00053FEEFF|nr:uncharacterized protein At4g33100 [Beta vulgaris subsp. vulgaris]KMT17898.1 hypothetical protein BVRB_2g034280 [Beta vulgaris subsp. vulgaris]
MKMGIIRDKRTSHTSTSPCADLRIAYNNCFNRWYAEKYVKGQWQNEECVVEWEKYRKCLSQHLEDKQLSRFLEAEASGIPSSGDRVDRKNSFDGASMGAAK